jgi:hypothetical protein
MQFALDVVMLTGAPVVMDPPPVPAPIAVLKSAAFNAETVLLAFTRRNVIADGLANPIKLLPTVVELPDDQMVPLVGKVTLVAPVAVSVTA